MSAPVSEENPTVPRSPVVSCSRRYHDSYDTLIFLGWRIFFQSSMLHIHRVAANSPHPLVAVTIFGVTLSPSLDVETLFSDTRMCTDCLSSFILLCTSLLQKVLPARECLVASSPCRARRTSTKRRYKRPRTCGRSSRGVFLTGSEQTIQ